MEIKKLKEIFKNNLSSISIVHNEGHDYIAQSQLDSIGNDEADMNVICIIEKRGEVEEIKYYKQGLSYYELSFCGLLYESTKSVVIPPELIELGFTEAICKYKTIFNHDDIIKHIQKAKEEAIRKGILDAMIIIDEDLAYVNKFYIASGKTGFLEIPTMIMGMKVKYQKNLTEDLGVNFIIKEDKSCNPYPQKDLSDYSTDELLNEIKKRLEQE